MHAFVFGSGFCHLFSFWKIWLPPTYGLKHASARRSTATFSWEPLVLAEDDSWVGVGQAPWMFGPLTRRSCASF